MNSSGDIYREEAVLRAEGLGASMAEESECERLFAALKCTERVLLRDIGAEEPLDEGLAPYLVDRAVGMYLRERRLRAPESLPQLAAGPGEKRISLGDASVEYRDTVFGAEAFDHLVALLEHSGEWELASIRRLVW